MREPSESVKPSESTGGSAHAAWGTFALLSLVIFATVPLARSLERVVREWAGDAAFLLAAFAAVGVAGFASLRALRGLASRRRVWIVAAMLGYAAAAYALRRNPVESIHLIEYALLGAVAQRALGAQVRDLSSYPAAALLALSVGVLDEALQWLAPTRHWDLRDIAINGFAAAGVQLPLAFARRPADVRLRFLPAGCVRLARAALLALVLLGASLLNTPARIAWLAAHVPGLSALATLDDVMIEYGHRFETAQIGVWRSRFSLAELADEDARRAGDAARALGALPGADHYETFLARYTPISDPFLHEFRVHLFRRDRYLETAEWHPDDERWYRADLTVALREDRILRRHFARSLAATGSALSAGQEAKLTALELREKRYESRVAEGLVTAISERGVAAALGISLLLLVACERAASHALASEVATRPASS